MPISILMSKMIFIKYLPPVRPKLFQNEKCLEFIEIWHIEYFYYANLDLKPKYFYQVLTKCKAKIYCGIYWYLA